MEERTRLQSADEPEPERYDVKTLGDLTKIGNAVPMPVAGVGLVVGLAGTGGEAPPDAYRAQLEDYLRKKGVKNVKELMTSTECAMVLVSAMLPPGLRKGEAIDVEVQLPPRTKATSLRGGVLQLCELKTYNSTRNLMPDYKGVNATLVGHTIARAEGPILVGLHDANEDTREKRGRIWGGGKSLIPVPLSLVLNPDFQTLNQAVMVANRVNDTFAPFVPHTQGQELAKPENNVSITLNVPPQYRLNIPRYLRVVRVIPRQDVAERPLESEGGRCTYRQKLAEDLLDPSRTVVCALRLEALGPGSKNALKMGLQSPHPLVRFCSAEALAYLGCPACGEELAHVVEKQPLLRSYALTALASLDESVSYDKLERLLCSSLDDEARFGAFNALRTLDERHPAVKGELLNESFWMHEVAPGTPALIHISTNHRAEIVLFGEEPSLKPPFNIQAGEFILTATPEDDRCMIACLPEGSPGPTRRPCSLRLKDVLRTMADLGGQYPEAVEMLQQAHRCKALSCRVRVDALPQSISVQDLARLGRTHPNLTGDAAITASGADLGATPTLYENPHGPAQP
jgi:hypothetical protein